MTRFKSIFAALAGLLCLASCNGKIDSASDVISSINVSQAPDNVLRYYVSMDFSVPCTYRIDYHELADPSAKASTREFESGGKDRAVIMFIKPQTDYVFNVTVSYGGNSFTSEDYSFTTKALPKGVPTYTVDTAYPNTLDLPGYILHGQASSPTGFLTFTDTEGNVVWYQDFDEAVRHFYFDPKTNTIVLLKGFKNSLSDVKFQRFCNNYMKIDLEGNVIEEWKTSPSAIEYPHHDIKLTEDGNLVLLHGVKQVCDLSSIGGGSSVDVLHDGFTIMNAQGEKIYTWDTTCEIDPVKDNEYLDTLEKYYDLVHANSVSWDTEGNYYFTLNNLNELWKIEASSGKVLYRVGEFGNITIPEDALCSGIHSSVPIAPDKILVFDNGSDSGVSRALVYEVDQDQRKASVSMSVSIPSELSSTDRSNVEIIDDGKMLFFGSTAGRCCLFTDMDGNILRVIRRSGISYRTHYFSSIEY